MNQLSSIKAIPTKFTWSVDLRDHAAEWRKYSTDSLPMNDRRYLPLDGGIFVSCKTNIPARLMMNAPQLNEAPLPITDWQTEFHASKLLFVEPILDAIHHNMEDVAQRPRLISELVMMKFGREDVTWSELREAYSEYFGTIGPIIDASRRPLKNGDVYLEFEPVSTSYYSRLQSLIWSEPPPRLLELQTLNILGVETAEDGTVLSKAYRFAS